MIDDLERIPEIGKGRRQVIAIVLGSIIAALAASGVIVVALQVDDWQRDLRTNVAETAHDAADPLMRPLRTSEMITDVALTIRRAAQRLRGWTYVGDVETASGLELRFKRVTRWFRFTDDVRVSIEDRGVNRLVHVRSASRFGGADLGQNPRNIRELTRVLRELLQGASAVSY